MEKDTKDKTPINALPEYQIRTMKNDLAGLSPEKIKATPEKTKKGAPPDKLPIIPEAPLPEEPIKLKKTKKKKPAPKPKKPKRLKRKPKLSVVIIIIAIILGGIALFFYWQGSKPSPLPTEDPSKPKPIKPLESLISVDSTKMLSLSTQKSLFEILKKEIELNQPIGAFKRIAILKNEKKLLSLNEFFEKLETIIPPYALTELKENYNLLLYNQDNKKRLGLIIEANNPENLKQQLKFWEQTMINDLKKLFLAEILGQPASPEFQDIIYPETAEPDEQINIRYIDFPETGLSFNHSIVNNLFVLTTSKQAMYEIVDNLLKTTD